MPDDLEADPGSAIGLPHGLTSRLLATSAENLSDWGVSNIAVAKDAPIRQAISASVHARTCRAGAVATQIARPNDSQLARDGSADRREWAMRVLTVSGNPTGYSTAG